MQQQAVFVLTAYSKAAADWCVGCLLCNAMWAFCPGCCQLFLFQGICSWAGATTSSN